MFDYIIISYISIIFPKPEATSAATIPKVFQIQFQKFLRRFQVLPSTDGNGALLA